jgi:Glyoxalase-like domain
LVGRVSHHFGGEGSPTADIDDFVRPNCLCGTPAKNRVHVDLASGDVDAELDRFLTLGASLQPEQLNDDVIVLRDPEGNEFCLLR